MLDAVDDSDDDGEALALVVAVVVALVVAVDVGVVKLQSRNTPSWYPSMMMLIPRTSLLHSRCGFDTR